MLENEVKIYEVIIGDDSEKEIKRLVRKKGFKSLPKQIIDLVDSLEKGELVGNIILSYPDPIKSTFINYDYLRLMQTQVNLMASESYMRLLYLTNWHIF